MNSTETDPTAVPADPQKILRECRNGIAEIAANTAQLSLSLNRLCERQALYQAHEMLARVEMGTIQFAPAMFFPQDATATIRSAPTMLRDCRVYSATIELYSFQPQTARLVVPADVCSRILDAGEKIAVSGKFSIRRTITGGEKIERTFFAENVPALANAGEEF